METCCDPVMENEILVELETGLGYVVKSILLFTTLGLYPQCLHQLLR